MKRKTIKQIPIILAILISAACGRQKNSITHKQVIGDWETIKGENEYIRFEKIDSDYVYSAYTYDRLAASGTWELDNYSITINIDGGTSTTLAVRFVGDTMEFNNGDESYFRVATPSESKKPIEEIGEIQILEQITKNINSVFSDIEPFNEDWVSKGVNWQRIRTEIRLKKDDLTKMNELSNQISQFLVNRGFEVDTNRISEIVTTYIKGNLTVMLRLNTSPEPATGESVSIDVISGIENK